MKNILKGALVLSLVVMLMVGAYVQSEFSANRNTGPATEQSLVTKESPVMEVGSQIHSDCVAVADQCFLLAPIVGVDTAREGGFCGDESTRRLPELSLSATDNRGGQNLPPKKPLDFRSQFSSETMSNLKRES